MGLFELLFYATLTIIGLAALLHIIVDAFSKIPKKARDFIFLVLAIVGILTGQKTLKETTNIEEPLNRHTAVIDSMMMAQEQRIMHSLKFRLNMQDTLANIQNTQDTILVKIALLDTCIDKHFWSTNKRLSDIERLLSP